MGRLSDGSACLRCGATWNVAAWSGGRWKTAGEPRWVLRGPQGGHGLRCRRAAAARARREWGSPCARRARTPPDGMRPPLEMSVSTHGLVSAGPCFGVARPRPEALCWDLRSLIVVDILGDPMITALFFFFSAGSSMAARGPRGSVDHKVRPLRFVLIAFVSALC